MGHIQPKTPVHCDNVTAVGIANSTVKRQRSRSMEMRFFWILVISAHKICTHYTGTRVKRTWLITKVNIMQADIILKSALGICMNLILRENYRGPIGPAL
jgi:hypothetical protein